MRTKGEVHARPSLRSQPAFEGQQCTRTAFTCYMDDGMLHEGASGRLDRLTVGHLQTSESASLIDHRWGQMGLSCELHFDQRFTVQAMTRTGGGGALVNDSATGILENWQPESIG